MRAAKWRGVGQGNVGPNHRICREGVRAPTQGEACAPHATRLAPQQVHLPMCWHTDAARSMVRRTAGSGQEGAGECGGRPRVGVGGWEGKCGVRPRGSRGRARGGWQEGAGKRKSGQQV